MLFKNKKCSKCQSVYEEVLDECPYCSTPNTRYVELGIPKKIIMLPWLNQIGLLLVGLIGLVVLQYIFSFIFGSTLGETSTLALLLANVVPYILILFGLFATLIFFRKKIFKSFRKPYDFLIGLAFGIVILGISYLYSNVFLEAINIGVNNNQSTFELLVGKYPISCIIIFAIVAPIVEEMTYRLGLFSFAYRVNKYLAYAVVIIIFGLIHFDFMGNLTIELLNLPNYLIAGFLFCLAYRFSGLAGCLTAHTLNNLISVIISIILIKYGN